MRIPFVAIPICLLAVVASARPVAAQSLTFDTSRLADSSLATGSTLSLASAVPPPVVSFDSADDQRGPYRRGRGGEGSLGIRLFGAVDIERMLAHQSFSASFGSPMVFGFGAGVDLVDVRAGLFLRVSLTRLAKTGSRSDGTVSNGIALNVTMMPVDFAVGWRFNQMTRNHTATPYVGGGAVVLRYSEQTPIGVTTDNMLAWFAGYEAFGGVDMRMTRVITVAPEVEFRSLPGALGTGGLSQVFNETNLGGVSFRVMVSFRVTGR